MNSLYLFAPFETYMLADDTDRYPMTCHIRFWFEGELNRKVFEESLNRALLRHPFLTSMVRQSGFWGLRRWYFCPIQPILHEILKWQTNNDELRLDRQKTPDFRTKFIVRTSGNESEIIIQFHHSVCDGIGIFQFFEDLLLLYDEKISGKPHQLKTLDPSLLLRRFSFGLTRRDWRLRLRLDLRRIQNFWKTFAQPLAKSHHTTLSTTADLAAAVRVVLPLSVTQRLQQSARSAKVTLNDVLLFHFYRMIALVQNLGTERIIRIGVPTSVRTPDDEAAPAANFISMVFLDRIGKDFFSQTSTEKVLQGISEEMNQIKNDRMGLTLLRLLNWLSKVPAAMFALVKTPLCMASAVLTNLGRPFQNSKLMHPDGFVRTGNLKMIGLDTMPPVRPGTNISLSVNGYAGQLSLTLRYDSRSFSKNDAEEILKVFTDQLSSI